MASIDGVPMPTGSCLTATDEVDACLQAVQFWISANQVVRNNQVIVSEVLDSSFDTRKIRWSLEGTILLSQSDD